MTNARRREWLGGMTSFALHGALFIPLKYYFGDLIAALVILASSITLANSYRWSTNSYLVGARWGTFLTLGLMSWARHSYWYRNTLDTFKQLQDIYTPRGLWESLCQGSPTDAIIIGITSLGILWFYAVVMGWPEWTERWELVRRSTFSASLGFQTLIFTAVFYPSVLTLTLALFFSSIISPIIRRQIRLNHLVFLILVPLFAFTNVGLSIGWSFIAGLLFLYGVAIERSLTPRSASFSFFLGVTFLMLSYAVFAHRVGVHQPGTWAGIFALLGLLLSWTLAWACYTRADTMGAWLQRLSAKVTPRTLQSHRWWSPRALWVEREVHHRDQKLYTSKTTPRTIGTVFFGPRPWIEQGLLPSPSTELRLHRAAPILVLSFYALWFLIDVAVNFAPSQRILLLAILLIGTLFTLAFPLLLMADALRAKRGLSAWLTFGAAFAALLSYVLFMASVVGSGLFNVQTLNNLAEGATASQESKQQMSLYQCSPPEEHKLFNGHLWN